jgi:hypothetical protein
MKENTPKSKVAALTSYQCLIRHISKLNCMNLLSESFPHLIKLLEDPSEPVRISICKLLQALAEYQSEIMLTERILKPYLSGFIRMIQEADDLYVKHMSIMFEKLMCRFEPNSQNQFFIDAQGDLAIALLNAAFKPPRTNDLSICETTMGCLVQMVLSCFEMTAIREFYEKFFEAIEKALAFNNRDHRVMLIEGLFICLGMMNVTVNSKRYHVPKDWVSRTFAMAQATMQKERVILQEGLFLMGSVAIMLKADFGCFIDEYLAYAREAIMNSRNDPVIATAFESLGNVAKETGLIDDKVLANFFIPEILKRMSNKNVPLEDRISLFLVIGDIALSNINAVSDHLEGILCKYEEAFKAVVEMLVGWSHHRKIETTSSWNKA